MTPEEMTRHAEDYQRLLAALRDDRIGELLVVDALPEVIGWHEKGMVPLGKELTDDPRCRYVHGDFFALAADPATGFDPNQAGRKFDAVLLDIDHTPTNVQAKLSTEMRERSQKHTPDADGTSAILPWGGFLG